MATAINPATTDAPALPPPETIYDPTQFARTWLRCDNWRVQDEILKALDRTSARVAVKACHASSKTFTAAEAVLWFVARYPHEKTHVITTATTWNQVERALWGDIHAICRKCMYPFRQQGKLLATELRLGTNQVAYGLSTSVTKSDEGVKFQSAHADHMLIIADEAPGLDPRIWEAIEGISAGGDVRILALGNPTIASGPFYDAFTSNRSGWRTFTITAFDTPNLEGLTLDSLRKLPPDELDKNERPYLITRRWVLDRANEWGEQNPRFQARVLGQFPVQAEDALLSLAWLERAATATPAEVKAAGEVFAGIDVAGPGEDETVLALRRGPRIIKLQPWSSPDPRGDIVRELEPYRRDLRCVNIDSAGIGWYLYLHLLDMGFPVVPVNVGERPSDTEQFANLKAQLYWGLRMRLQQGDIGGLNDERTIAQLASIRWRTNPRGQTTIESKEDARKRGVKSPDRAEAIMLAYADVPQEQEEIVTYEEKVQIDPELDEWEARHGW